MKNKIITRNGVDLSISIGLNGFLCISTMLDDLRIKQLYTSYDTEESCIEDFLEFYSEKKSEFGQILDDE